MGITMLNLLNNNDSYQADIFNI